MGKKLGYSREQINETKRAQSKKNKRIKKIVLYWETNVL